VEIQLARQPVDWGPGVRGNVALSSFPPAYDFVTLRARFGRVKFTHLHGFLLPDEFRKYETVDGFIRRSYVQKFVAAHRIEANPLRGVFFGLTETIVYGERNIDLAYLNPLVFFWSAQHGSHDRDNETLSADIEIVVKRGVRLYGALFVDEIYLKEIFSDDARNKVALQGGFHLTDPLGLHDTDVRVEYARVQPCVYTHKFTVNTYRHDGYALGHWLGQHGDDLFVMAAHRFSRRLRLVLRAARTRRGEKGELPWCHDQPKRYSFLKGVVDRTNSLGASVEFEPLKDLRALVSYHWNKRYNRDQVPGTEEVLNELAVQISFDY
jgi:hypothetical protein